MSQAAPKPRTLLLVYVLLLFLLALSAGATRLLSGTLADSFSLLVATAKATLITLFFMRARYEPPRTRVMAFAALAWLAFFFLLTFADYATRGIGGIVGK